MKVYIIFDIDFNYEDHRENDAYCRYKKEICQIFKTRKSAVNELLRIKSHYRKSNIKYSCPTGFYTENEEYFIKSREVYK